LIFELNPCWFYLSNLIYQCIEDGTQTATYNYCLHETVHIVNDLGDIAQIEISKCSPMWSLLIPKTIEVPIKYYLYWVNALMDIN